MLIPGTEMHVVTALFVCFEIVILFYLIIHRLARPDDKKAYLNIILIFLLIVYNVTGGLLPDPNLPGTYFLQTSIAYATGFITPCYFPYYVFKAFGLEKMKFHAYKGVYLCLIFPYILFVILFAVSGKLDTAKNLLVIPVAYALWVIYSLAKALRFKYNNNFSSKQSKEEAVALFLSLTPWVGLPVIDFFNQGQAVEAATTNLGFLLLFAYQVKSHIQQTRIDHQKLAASELRLQNWNANLQIEVEKRTKALSDVNEQRVNAFVNLAHEIKTPLTLMTNYFDEYINKRVKNSDLVVVQRSLNKLSADISGLFDLERFNRGFAIYDHNQVSNFSEIVRDSLPVFREYAAKRNIELAAYIEDKVFVKADPLAINRIINNLLENAIKFSDNNSTVEVYLNTHEDKIRFIVKDFGIGIPIDKQKRVFEPYYQISNRKSGIQGMGLGLPIVKKVVDSLNGKICMESPHSSEGTKITVILNSHQPVPSDTVAKYKSNYSLVSDKPVFSIAEPSFDRSKQTILIVEDNSAMINYLIGKLQMRYNVYGSSNGHEAIKRMKILPTLPNLIITDIMMDHVDGYKFAEIIIKDPSYNHIPFIFLSAKSEKADKLRALSLGAIDFISKPFSIQELCKKIESILENANNLKRSFFNNRGNSHHPTGSAIERGFDTKCRQYNLTRREQEIVGLIAKGHSYKDIGKLLFISEKTVTRHVQNIFEKVEVSNKVALINKICSL